MSDRIEGVAILDRHLLDNGCSVEVLHFVCVRENGDRQPWTSHIPIVAKVAPLPNGYTEDHVWRYEEKGEWLDVKPSVKMSYDVRERHEGPPVWREYFHNAGEWGVKFERWPGESNDGAGIWQRMCELNRALLDRPIEKQVRSPGVEKLQAPESTSLDRVRFSPRIPRVKNKSSL